MSPNPSPSLSLLRRVEVAVVPLRRKSMPLRFVAVVVVLRRLKRKKKKPLKTRPRFVAGGRLLLPPLRFVAVVAEGLQYRMGAARCRPFFVFTRIRGVP
jgi:hypothetical protein